MILDTVELIKVNCPGDTSIEYHIQCIIDILSISLYEYEMLTQSDTETGNKFMPQSYTDYDLNCNKAYLEYVCSHTPVIAKLQESYCNISRILLNLETVDDDTNQRICLTCNKLDYLIIEYLSQDRITDAKYYIRDTRSGYLTSTKTSESNIIVGLCESNFAVDIFKVEDYTILTSERGFDTNCDDINLCSDTCLVSKDGDLYIVGNVYNSTISTVGDSVQYNSIDIIKIDESLLRVLLDIDLDMYTHDYGKFESSADEVTKYVRVIVEGDKVNIYLYDNLDSYFLLNKAKLVSAIDKYTSV